MSRAYILLAHREPELVLRLVSRLAGTDTAFFIHVDRNAADAVAAGIAERVGSLPNVRLMTRRRVRWAGFSLVQVALDGLAAVEDSGMDPDQTVLISGQHYPIKPPEEISERLSDPGVAFMQHSPLPNREWWPDAPDGGLERFRRVYMPVPRRGLQPLPLLRRKLPGAYKPYGGSQFWSLGRAHRRHVLEVTDSDPGLMRAFRHSRACDEVFFQTILLSSPLRESVVNDHLLYVEWLPGANSPCLLTASHFPAISRSAALFARKFESAGDEVLEMIDRELIAAR